MTPTNTASYTHKLSQKQEISISQVSNFNNRKLNFQVNFKILSQSQDPEKERIQVDSQGVMILKPCVSKPETTRLMTVHHDSQGWGILREPALLGFQEIQPSPTTILFNSPFSLFNSDSRLFIFNSEHITKIIPPKIKGSKLTCTNQLFSYLSRLLP